MKRADLKVGDELYWAKPYDWDHYLPGDKVTVVSVEPHKWSSLSRRNKPQPTGPGVLVKVSNRYGGSDHEKVVMLAHLRGPYESIKAEVDADRTARDANDRRLAAESDAWKVRAGALIERLQTSGMYARPGDGCQSIVISVPDMEKLLDAYESREG